jgi:sugar lactone lactonase YvrE
VKKTLSSLLILLLVTACGKKNKSDPTPVISAVTATVTTLAGSGAHGSANGTGISASFFAPNGVAVDAAGNVYVADAINNMVRKISPGGVVTTLAGSGARGSVNGTGISASFSGPSGVAVDAAGNVYVADAYNNRIRKISSGGVVTTLAGNTPGFVNGTGTSASFYSPQGIAVDGVGNIYVADKLNSVIRKISPGGVVSTFAGSGAQGSANGQAALASFSSPDGVAVDAAGNIYVADPGNGLVRKISSGGLVTTLAGSGTMGSANGKGILASFYQPTDVAVDVAGNVYVTDIYNNLIRKISPEGVVTTLAGSGAVGSVNGIGALASFNLPDGLTVDGAGSIYVADRDNCLIRKIVVQ